MLPHSWPRASFRLGETELKLESEGIWEDCVRWKRWAADTVYFSHHFLSSGESKPFQIYCLFQPCIAIALLRVWSIMCIPHDILYACCLKAAEESTCLFLRNNQMWPEAKTDIILLNYSHGGISTEAVVILLQTAESGINVHWPLR